MQKQASESYRIVFMGTPEFAVPSLKALLEGPDEVVAVVTQPDRRRGRGRKYSPSPVKEAALGAGLAVFQPERAGDADFLDEIRRLKPDLLVVAAYGQILSRELLDIPAVMPINVHGSLLPKYRGAAPIQWALINGETETGITIMKMDAGMDTGPMLLKSSIAIGPDESFGELYVRLSRLGADLLSEALDKLRSGTLSETPQPDEGVSHAPAIEPEMAKIDWNRPAAALHGLIRAFDPTPGAYTLWEGRRLRLYRPFLPAGACAGVAPGTVIRAGEDGLVVAAGDAPLGIRELQWPGKRRLPAADFLRGRPVKEGTSFLSGPS